jgi:hypothetical protein
MKKNTTLQLRTKPRDKARTLKKGENLRDSDRCFICSAVADGVRRRGSRYSPVCFDCMSTHRTPSEQHFAEQVEDLVRHWSTRPEVSSLVSNIVFDLQNEVGISVDHPGVVRLFLLASFDELKNPNPSLSRKRAAEMLGHITELLNGCSPRRLKNIDKRYNAGYPLQAKRKQEVPA